jgi:predicted methyltransferase
LHLLLQEVVRAGDLVVDATAGNGYDTVFLAEAVGASGKVVAMDLQSEAIQATRDRLLDKGMEERVELHQVSHVELGKLISPEKASAIVFNLGYLPGSDHSVITERDSTLVALGESVLALKPGGVLAVVCYPGHEGGHTEAEAVENFLRDLGSFRLAKYQMLFTKSAAPFLLIASKRSENS